MDQFVALKAAQRNKVVYLHRRATDGVVFYVGMGSERRAKSKDSRTAEWRFVVDGCGFVVEIVGRDLTRTEALALEIETIAKYDHAALTNKNAGGGGCNIKTAEQVEKSRQRHSEETRRKMSASRRGVKRGLSRTIEEYRASMRRAAEVWKGSKHSDETKRIMSIKAKERGVVPGFGRMGGDANIKREVYTFQHPEHGIEKCCPYDLRMKYGLIAQGLSMLVLGRARTHKGWRVLTRPENQA